MLTLDPFDYSPPQLLREVARRIRREISPIDFESLMMTTSPIEARSLIIELYKLPTIANALTPTPQDERQWDSWLT